MSNKNKIRIRQCQAHIFSLFSYLIFNFRMNMTTTVGYSYATDQNTLEQFYALFVNPTIAIRFYQIGYSFTFLLGFLGNIASLLTFSRPTLRKVSTGCLFIVLAISDILYLLMCIFDYLEFGFSVIIV